MYKGPRKILTTNLLAAALSVMLFGLFTLPLVADEDDDKQVKAEELAKLRQQISALRDELNQTKSLHDSVRAELRQLESDINLRVRSLKKVKRQLRHKTRKLVRLKKQQHVYQKNLQTHQTLLGQQVRAAYVIGRQEFLKLMLNQEDPAVVGRAMTYYDYFNRARSQRIDDAKQTLVKLETVKQKIQQEQKQLKELQQTQQQETAALKKTSGARAIVVARLNTELKNKGETLTRWLENEKQLQRVVEAIQEVMPETLTHRGERPVFSTQRGKLKWPTRGKLKAVFGKPREAGQVLWNGVLITAGEGKEVRAVSHGRIAYADWLRGYGLLIIIDHGEGYMSLYGHNQSIFKETGDWVEAGEVVGSVGKSGGQNEAALYFEIRHKGKPRNPAKWCKS